MTILIIKTSEQSFSGLKYFYYCMISAVSLQRFIGDESQSATMQRTFVLIIMSYPSYRRHARLYLFTRRPRPHGVDLSCNVYYMYIFASPCSFRRTCPCNMSWGFIIPCDRTFKVFPPFSWLHPLI